MSTYQPYDLRIQEEAREWARLERQRREAELARLRAEEAAAVHRETLAYAARSGLIDREALRRQGLDLSTMESTLSSLSTRSAATREEVAAMAGRLHGGRQRLEVARREAEEEARRLHELVGRSAQVEARIRETHAEAVGTLESISALSSANADYVEQLSREHAAGERLAAETASLEARCRAAATELRFLTQQADREPAALITLVAMEATGRRLAEVGGPEGLRYYFEGEDGRHQIAVRVAAAEVADAGPPRWLLELETFAEDPDLRWCLEATTDFEDEVEASGRATLQPLPGRVYPKPPGTSCVLESPPPHHAQPLPGTAPAGPTRAKATDS